jgi:hypothetical protein
LILDLQAKGVWLRTELVNSKEFLVVGHSEIDKAFSELKLSRSGIIDANLNSHGMGFDL